MESFKVKGMSCGHCVKAVEKALGEIPGVKAVQVDLASGQVSVEAAGPLDMGMVKEKIEKAGYELG
ncbi:Heavy-metal-associated domain-containing protein [Desulfacinum hydrothermale DSM 13146]|uniref:Heavy-metal-associated domain-containing protein n=1 Tax=Desulfacinum hydrothermale DSM 13146 TaxID=1121390 RepID=A0A1W1X9Z0_9BACT|nr:copper ion binding protein [Desulfacinum hydrothermale]SMC20756.1 Heavy-metal-associated domain-containing protein [Desulfacinum hydrothermale DSM 13146]